MTYEPNTRTARMWITPYEVAFRLNQLQRGMTPGLFVEAVRQGDLQRRLCTVDDYESTPGYVGWARHLRTLREQLRLTYGWTGYKHMDIPVSLNRNETLCVGVSWEQDARIGRDLDDPSTKVKGPNTSAAVRAANKFDFGGDNGTGIDLWYHLVDVTDPDDLYHELARPGFTDNSGRITKWDERIVLGRLLTDDGLRRRPPEVDIPPADVSVIRKKKSAA